MTSPCVFCDIITGRAEASIVARWPETLAIRPLNPVTHGHLLVIPVVHVRDAAHDPEVTASTMRRAAQLVGWPRSAYNLITSIGVDATQSVFHLHVHVVPRSPGDGLHLPWTGQARD